MGFVNSFCATKNGGGPTYEPYSDVGPSNLILRKRLELIEPLPSEKNRPKCKQTFISYKEWISMFSNDEK